MEPSEKAYAIADEVVLGALGVGNAAQVIQRALDEAAAAERAKVVARIAEAAHAIGWQAGVGAMETAGSIVSFLYANPHRIADFMSGGSVLDWPPDWHQKGYLTWQGMDGKIHYPGEREVKQ